MTMLVKSTATEAAAVTPSDSTVFPKSTKGLYVGVSGNVAVVLEGGSSVTFNNLASGIIHPIAVKQVKSTGTTATNILAVYY